MYYDVQPILNKVMEQIDSHKVGEGQYARWLWQDAEGSRELGANPYGCADAANLLYMLGCFPRDVEERAKWISVMQEMQDPESGFFYEFYSTKHG